MEANLSTVLNSLHLFDVSLCQNHSTSCFSICLSRFHSATNMVSRVKIQTRGGPSSLNDCISTLFDLQKQRKSNNTRVKSSSHCLKGFVLNCISVMGHPTRLQSPAPALVPENKHYGRLQLAAVDDVQAMQIHHQFTLGNFPSLHPPGKVLCDSTWSTVQ